MRVILGLVVNVSKRFQVSGVGCQDKISDIANQTYGAYKWKYRISNVEERNSIVRGWGYFLFRPSVVLLIL